MKKPITGKKLAGLLAALATVVTFGVAFSTTQAVFTSSVSNGSNTFTTGTVSINTTNGNGSAYTAFSATGMAPGNVYFSDLRVVNSGSMPMRYAMSSTPTALSEASGGIANGTQLANNMVFGIKKISGTTCDLAAWNGSTDVVLTNTAGGFGNTVNTARNVIGNPAAGSHTGDRTLAAGASEVFCIRGELPVSSPNATQGSSATFRFDFNAEQTANN